MKDSKGHGSNGRGGRRVPLPGHPFHGKTTEQLRYIAKDAHEAAQAMRGHDAAAEGKYLDQVNDAHTVLGYRQRMTDAQAADHMANGHPKSSLVPIHDAHRYNPTAVNQAIESSNRAGRRIGGKEARAIHSLLKGRH